MEEDEIYYEYVRRKRLIRSFCVRATIWTILSLFTFAFYWYITNTPILTNQMALGQMNNSNELFVAMTAYQEFVNLAETARNALIFIIISFVGIDTIDLVRNLKAN